MAHLCVYKSKKKYPGWKREQAYLYSWNMLYVVNYSEGTDRIGIIFEDERLDHLSGFIAWFCERWTWRSGESAQFYDLVHSVSTGQMEGFEGYDSNGWDQFKFTVDSEGIKIKLITYKGEPVNYHIYTEDSEYSLSELETILELYFDAYRKYYGIDLSAVDEQEYPPEEYPQPPVSPVYPVQGYPFYNFNYS